MSLEEASLYKLPFEYVKTYVKPERDKNNRQARKEKWWQYGEKRPAMRKALEGLSFYFALPKVTKYIFFQSINTTILPCEANMVVASEDYYILGVLNSKFHRDWTEVQCSSLGLTFRYTNTTCFETFPFLWRDTTTPLSLASPPAPLLKERGVIMDQVANIMKELDEFRLQMMKERNYGITKLYNEFFYEPQSKLSKLHKQLDEAVCKVYEWKYEAEKNYNKELFDLNNEIYEMEGRG